jgi:hypothetical protein
MKTIFTAFILVICLSNAYGQFSFSTNGLDIKFLGVDADDFEALTINDTTYIGQLSYEGLDGAKMIFSNEPRSIKINYQLGFLQYTIDDNQATPLDFIKTTKQIELRSNKLPYFYNAQPKDLNAHYLLGYQSIDELSDAIIDDHYEEIKFESYKYQTEFYSALLKDDRFKECCPEYLEQATDFLESEAESFKSIEDLHLEFTYLATIMQIKYNDENKVKILTVIIK